MTGVGAALQRNGHVVVAALLSLIISTRGISTLPLSHDEFYSLHAITTGLGGHTWEAPLIPYYALLWVWSLGGQVTADAWLRMMSVTAVVLAAIATSATAARLMSQAAGYWAAVLVAMSAATQRFGQEARPYAVGMAVFAAATYLLVRGLEGGSRRFWIGYSLLLFIGATLVPQGLAVLLAYAVVVLADEQSRLHLRKWLTYSAIAVVPVAVAGAALMISNSFPNMHNWLSAPTLLHIPDGFIWIGDAGATTAVASAGYGVALAVIGLASRRGLPLVAGAVVAALGIWCVSAVGTSFWQGSSFVPLVPLVVAGAAVTLATLGRTSALAIAVFLIVVALPAYTSVRLPRTGEPDMRLAVQILEGESPVDAIVFGDPTDAYGLWPAIKHYGTAAIAAIPTRAPSADFWAVYGADECVPVEDWDIGGSATLKLCPAARSHQD